MSGQEHLYNQKNSGTPGEGGDELHTLIRLCLAKDRASQKKLYDRYAAILYGVIRRYIYSDAPAQEILNDSFFKIFTKLHTYTFSGSFEGWMRRIAVNTITDYLRKNLKHDKVSRQDVTEYDAVTIDDAASKIAYKDLLRMVHELPDVHRAVFNLFVFEEYAHKEIAQELGISENNSRWHLNDARKRLKEKINSVM